MTHRARRGPAFAPCARRCTGLDQPRSPSPAVRPAQPARLPDGADPGAQHRRAVSGADRPGGDGDPLVSLHRDAGGGTQRGRPGPRRPRRDGGGRLPGGRGGQRGGRRRARCSGPGRERSRAFPRSPPSAPTPCLRQAVAPGDEGPADGAAGTREEAGAPAGLPDAPPFATRTRPAPPGWQPALLRADRMVHPRQRAPRRDELAAAQHPFAPCWAARTRASRRSRLRPGAGRPLRRPLGGAGAGQRRRGEPGAGRRRLAVPLLLVLVHERCRAARRRPARQGPSTPPGWCPTSRRPSPRRSRSSAAGDLLENTLQAHAALVVDSCAGCSPCWPRRWRGACASSGPATTWQAGWWRSSSPDLSVEDSAVCLQACGAWKGRPCRGPLLDRALETCPERGPPEQGSLSPVGAWGEAPENHSSSHDSWERQGGPAGRMAPR